MVAHSCGAPPELTRLVRRCLEKDRRKRLQSIGDARLELQNISTTPIVAQPPSPGSRRREWIWMATAAVAAVIAIALGAALLRGTAPPKAPSIRASVPLPAGVELDGSGGPQLALSPDAGTLAFLARGAAGYHRELYCTFATGQYLAVTIRACG